MPVILVANPKGGVGKSTLSTHIAGHLAHQGHRVMLGDADRQQSSRRWLDIRPPQLPRIESWAFEGRDTVKPPKGVSHVVIDSPGGLKGGRLAALHRVADRIVIPLQPSLFDIQATHDFVQALHDLRRQTGHKPALGIVAMRAREGTLSLEQLQHFLDGLGVPVLTQLRDTQNYVQLAARGLTLWDVTPSRVERDRAQWQPLTAWLDS